MSLAGRTIRVATRGSRLALAQTQWVVEQLRSLFPGLQLAVATYHTTGDASQAAGVPLSQVGGKGLFTKELEDALLTDQADLAVHSLKDMPTDVPAGLAFGCIPEREVPWDAVVTEHNASLEDLPAGTRVGTSSLRRLAQLRHYRPDLHYVPIRGNVDTRLRKLAAGEVGALVMAAAGLIRAGFAGRARYVLPPEVCLPAAGQGALVVEMRAEDAEIGGILAALNHAPTAIAVQAERAFLATVTGAIPGSPHLPVAGAAGAAPPLGGSCQVPIAAFAAVHGGQLHLRGLVAMPDGSRLVGWEGEAPAHRSAVLGQAVAAAVLARGGDDILRTLHNGDQ